MFENVVLLTVFVTVGGLLVYRSLFAPSGSFGTWPMFTNVAYCRLDMQSDDGLPISMWDYELHQNYTGTGRTVAEFVKYMQVEHHCHITGEGVEASGEGYFPLKIIDGKVYRGNRID